MELILGVAALAALVVWLTSRHRRSVPPEDDVRTAIDRAALEEAERELASDGEAAPFGADDEPDDWGPGRP
jgi:hypothetical protein